MRRGSASVDTGCLRIALRVWPPSAPGARVAGASHAVGLRRGAAPSGPDGLGPADADRDDARVHVTGACKPRARQARDRAFDERRAVRDHATLPVAAVGPERGQHLGLERAVLAAAQRRARVAVACSQLSRRIAMITRIGSQVPYSA
jgi:hypothetical protein